MTKTDRKNLERLVASNGDCRSINELRCGRCPVEQYHGNGVCSYAISKTMALELLSAEKLGELFS